MTDYQELLFKALSYAPGPFWLALVFFPRKEWAMKAFDLFLLLLSLSFSAQVIPTIPSLLPLIATPTLDGLHQAFSSKQAFIGAWNHMILSDLWIGRWITWDAIKNNVSLWLRIPFIFVVLFFGPLGLAAYLLFRMIFLKKVFFGQPN